MDPLEQYLKASGGDADPLAAYLAEKASTPSPASPEGRRFAAGKHPLPRSMTESADVSDVTIPRDESVNAREPFERVKRGVPRLPGAINSLLDTASFGGLSGVMRLSNKINEATGRNPVYGPALSEIEQYRSENPTLSQLTDMPGYMSGAPRALATGIERAIPAASGPATQAARAILGSGLTSGMVAGSESAIRGDEPIEVAKEGGRGFVGGTAVGVPLSAGALLLRGGANAVLKSKGAKAREYLESRGQPLTASDTSDAAIGAAGVRADEEVKKAMVGYKQKVASGPYMEAINAIPQELADQPVNVTPIYRELVMAANDPANLQVADKLNTLVRMLGDRPLMTQQELNGLRRSLSGIAGVGETTSGKLAPLRKAYESVKALVDQGPYAEANRRFAAGSKDLNESLGMVGLDTSANPEQPITGNLRVKLQRAGQNTVTAGADTESLDLEAFKAKHPELANVIDAPEIIRRQGDIAYNMSGPSHGGFIERHGLHLSPVVLAAVHAMGGGWKGAAAIPLALAIQNRNALAGRLLYSPAQNASVAAQMLLEGVPQLSAPGRELVQEGR